MNGRRVTCAYCKRQLEATMPEIDLSLTWDHVRPESDGGWKRIPSCRKCNFLKDNLPPEDWFWFIGAHPGYWRQFDHPRQVAGVIREFRFNQAQAGQRPYRLKHRSDVPFVGDIKQHRR